MRSRPTTMPPPVLRLDARQGGGCASNELVHQTHRLPPRRASTLKLGVAKSRSPSRVCTVTSSGSSPEGPSARNDRAHAVRGEPPPALGNEISSPGSGDCWYRKPV